MWMPSPVISRFPTLPFVSVLETRRWAVVTQTDQSEAQSQPMLDQVLCKPRIS
jgi:hypothetical protein